MVFRVSVSSVQNLACLELAFWAFSSFQNGLGVNINVMLEVERAVTQHAVMVQVQEKLLPPAQAGGRVRDQSEAMGVCRILKLLVDHEDQCQQARCQRFRPAPLRIASQI
jgi:hypothetical protein